MAGLTWDDLRRQWLAGLSQSERDAWAREGRAFARAHFGSRAQTLRGELETLVNAHGGWRSLDEDSLRATEGLRALRERLG